MSRNNTQVSRRLMRMCSYDVIETVTLESEAYSLERASNHGYGDEHRRLSHPWRKFFKWEESPQTNNDPVTKLISVEAAQLRDKWVQFQNQCPKEDRLDLESYEPTIKSVCDMVQDLTAQWQSKRERGVGGKLTTYFHKFCGTLNAHSSMLKVLPEGNEYVSIFTGTLNAIIKASANHERIAETLSEALYSIRDHVIDCDTELEMFKTPAMVELVSELYAEIFVFLSSFMDWMTRKRPKRMLDSFNETKGRSFDDAISRINRKAARIKDRAAQSSRAELRDMRTTLEGFGVVLRNLERDARIGLQGQARQNAEVQYNTAIREREYQQARFERRQLEDSRQIKHLAAMMITMLRDNAHAFTDTGVTGSHLAITGVDWHSSGHDIKQAITWTADSVMLKSAHLEDYFHRDRVRLDCDPKGPIIAPQETIHRMIQWTTEEDSSSRLLWIDEPSTQADEFDNPISMLAAKFIHLAAQSGVPVISYFCELRRGESLRAGNTTAELQGIVALAYALLRQMTELLLPHFETQVDLSEDRFRQLDGTAKSWGDLVATLESLVDLMPDKVFCIIDGLSWVDDDNTASYIADLIRVLRKEKFRVLLTTTGRSPCLRDEVSIDETHSVQASHLAHAVRRLAF